MSFKEMKFRVDGTDHSVQIQKALFAAGYEWDMCSPDNDQGVHYDDRPFLYTEKDGGILYGTSEEFFAADCSTECELRNGVIVKAGATRLIEHEGIKYEVPAWANYLTRDCKERDVFAWEEKPEWKGELLGYQDNSMAKRCRVLPYVEPKPEGYFFVEI